jgi:hypothetical protein
MFLCRRLDPNAGCHAAALCWPNRLKVFADAYAAGKRSADISGRRGVRIPG